MDDNSKMTDPQIAIELAGIKTTLDRVLNHQIENKQKFEKIDDKINSIWEYVHNVDLKIIEGDNAVRTEVKENVVNAYKYVAMGGFGVIGALVGTIWAWIQNKLN